MIVVKIGTSSLTGDNGALSMEAIDKLVDEVAGLIELGMAPVIVSSGAIGAGLEELGFSHSKRPADALTLQAASAVGQADLVGTYKRSFARHQVVVGQVLISPYDFWNRQQYLHAKGTFARLIELGVVPVVNENDALADDAIRFGDNDRIAALVAQLIGATRLVLLTDTAGLFTGDPNLDPDASLIEEITEIDHRHRAAAGSASSGRGSGGMAAKLRAAAMASWSGIDTVIADASHPGVVTKAADATVAVGTLIRARAAHLSARRLWIAFALPAAGDVTVDDGARTALEHDGRSLLAAGVTAVSGEFASGDSVNVVAEDGELIAKGLSGFSAVELRGLAGKRSGIDGAPKLREVIHRDDMVLLNEEG
ncbi:MAG: glutamate 5-kinase [Acidobacteria bacterium]|nr:glutamate 5-kinase [Acidobacteriota bacterium]